MRENTRQLEEAQSFVIYNENHTTDYIVFACYLFSNLSENDNNHKNSSVSKPCELPRFRGKKRTQDCLNGQTKGEAVSFN